MSRQKLKILLTAIGCGVILAIFITGLIVYLCLSESYSSKKFEKNLLLNLDKDSIEHIYSHNNGISYIIWLQVKSIQKEKFKGIKYQGRVSWAGRNSYSIDNKDHFHTLIYIGARPKWWEIKLGYHVYKLESSDRDNPPHTVCMFFVSPDENDIYIFQSTSTRKN